MMNLSHISLNLLKICLSQSEFSRPVTGWKPIKKVISILKLIDLQEGMLFGWVERRTKFICLQWMTQWHKRNCKLTRCTCKHSSQIQMSIWWNKVRRFQGRQWKDISDLFLNHFMMIVKSLGDIKIIPFRFALMDQTDF